MDTLSASQTMSAGKPAGLFQAHSARGIDQQPEIRRCALFPIDGIFDGAFDPPTPGATDSTRDLLQKRRRVPLRATPRIVSRNKRAARILNRLAKQIHYPPAPPCALFAR